MLTRIRDPRSIASFAHDSKLAGYAEMAIDKAVQVENVVSLFAALHQS
jgi:hypothetical protein